MHDVINSIHVDMLKRIAMHFLYQFRDGNLLIFKALELNFVSSAHVEFSQAVARIWEDEKESSGNIKQRLIRSLLRPKGSGS